MEDSSLFMQWAMDTLQHENNPAPASAAAVHGGFSEATFPSLKALREASHAAEMVQELIADADVVRHAPNSWNSGDNTTANYNVPAGWGFGGATAASALPGSHGMMEAPPAMATRGRPPPGLVYRLPPTRRAGLKSLGSMAAAYAKDHIIAERKRREKINQRFIELSTVIPGLKKMDKATILLDATRYLKELQEKLKDLEQRKEAGGGSIETLVLVKKPCLHAAAARDDDGGSSLPASPPAGTPTEGKRLPEIEVQFSELEKTVAVRVHCENRKGVVVHVLAELEDLHLSNIHANVMPFTACTRIITITAKASFPCPAF
ncbi:transcription factor bHLH18 [Zea mays]|uniref:Transcription factor bHLH28 n=1 Tax=Zea mays TaxID=4577 RepID=A0A1D6KYW1_MAIZE|nr:transcription factor bHLH18 [Zea mays]ONM07571.1 Transcription factor bHLH28 [Zea mays]|eukprot:XP_008666761.1 transcription factor bHLH18 [Zea mays]